MPIVLTFPDEVSYNVAGTDYTHSLADHTATMILRGFAHGMRQMIGDAAAMTRDELAEFGDQADTVKSERRNKAFGSRIEWLNSEARTHLPSDDSLWVGEAKLLLRAFGVSSKACLAIKSVADATEALRKIAGDDARGNALVSLVNENAAKKKALLADPESAVQALIDAALKKKKPKAAE